MSTFKSTGIEAIAAERKRQIEVERWTPEHDSQHTDGSIALAASAYAIASCNGNIYRAGEPPPCWPWGTEWWKPKDRRSNLVKAGALIAAEIDRLDRATAPTEPGRGEGESHD